MSIPKNLLCDLSMGSMLGPIHNVQRLSEDIYTMSNYEQLMEEASEKGLHMKESKDFYEGRILETLKRLYKGKKVDEIRASLLGLEVILE